MTWTDFWYGIAAIFEAIFKILKKLAQVPNILVWITLACLLAFWTIQMIKQAKKAKRDGTYI